MEPVGVGIVVASLLNGLRHGLDVDHIAAIGDIVAAQADRQRSLLLASVYATGHATIVLGLGLGAIAIGVTIPPAVDAVMSKMVGVTLVLLGVYVLYSVVRYRGNARLRSRWQLASEVMRWWRGRRQQPVVIEHEHEHVHDSIHGHAHSPSPEADAPQTSRVLVATRIHRHKHQHVSVMPADPLPAYGSFTTFGVGVLHGIGAETPSQILLFLTAAGVGTLSLGVAVLGAFVVGMLLSNAAIAVAFTFGVRGRAPSVYSTLAFATALFSLGVGGSYLLG